MSSNAVEGLNHIFLVDKDGKQHQITNINILLTKQHPQGRCLYLNIEEVGEAN